MISFDKELRWTNKSGGRLTCRRQKPRVVETQFLFPSKAAGQMHGFRARSRLAAGIIDTAVSPYLSSLRLQTASATRVLSLPQFRPGEGQFSFWWCSRID